MVNEGRTLGDRIREARASKGKSLRQAAKDLGVTPSYLSDIENDRRVPAEAVLSKIAGLLGLDLNELMSLAGRFGEKAKKYVRERPTAVKLFRRIAEKNLDEKTLRRLLEEIEKTDKEKAQ